MKGYLISMFIDDELDLDTKIQFVEQVADDNEFKRQTIVLLKQEKLLRGEMVKSIPDIQLPRHRVFRWRWLQPVAVAAMLVVALLFIYPGMHAPVKMASSGMPHRFVVYLPGVNSASIVGSFTNWRPVPMQKVDSSGYWVLNLKLPVGEHRYNYVIENKRLIPDPTITTRELDDFGGQNSIIEVKRDV